MGRDATHQGGAPPIPAQKEGRLDRPAGGAVILYGTGAQNSSQLYTRDTRIQPPHAHWSEASSASCTQKSLFTCW